MVDDVDSSNTNLSLVEEHSSTQIRSSLSCDSPQNKPNNKTWSSSLKCSVSCTSLLPVFSIPSEKSPSSYVYRTNGAERGLCVVFSVDKFDPILCLPPRNGSLVDIQNIKRAFTSLDFRVIVHSNPTSESLFSLIRTISTQNLRDHDCFACVILSHGDEGGLIYATDGSIPVDRIIAPFRGDQCLDLRGKPKLFFIQPVCCLFTVLYILSMEADQYNGKTVLVINHTHMVSCFAGDELNLDAGVKFVNTKVIFQKSIWSNLVEAVIQYCRVVFDIFSTEKPISIVTFDDEEKIHSIWLNEDQNLDTIWNIFSQEGPPKISSLNFLERGSLPGLSSASHLLQMLTPRQKEINSGENKGRVVVLSMSMGNKVLSWIPDILSSLEKPIDTPDHMDVTSSEWVFVDLFPASEFSADLNGLYPEQLELPNNIDPNARHRFFYHKLLATNQELYQGLMRLAECHYNLSSTLVQDIPMKEEANVNSGSSMYGVEILHRAEVHDMLKRRGIYEKLLVRTDSENNKSISRPHSGFSKTLGIKWVTPKTSDTNFLRFAVATYRVTLADVCHRASTCLAQFVLGGRSVALAHRLQSSFPALPNDSNFLTSCSTDEALLLTCHGSVMYIHVLGTIFPMTHPQNIPLTSNPSVAPGDYRIQAFIDQILRPSRLAPASARLNYSVFPKERAQQHIERQTRYWPLMESQTLLDKIKLAAPIFENLPKEYLEPSEISACEESIVNIVNSIKQYVCLSDSRKNSSKRGSSSGTLPVAPVLQAEAIVMATEFDYILSLYSDISTEHEQIRNYWIQTISSSKTTDTLNGLNRLSNENDFNSLNLTEMIRLAKTIAYDQTNIVNSTIPLALIKIMKSLTVLCERLRRHTDSHDSKCITTQINQKSACNPVQSPKMMAIVEPADRTNFIDRLKSAKRRRVQTQKLDFVGVLTADSKGLCQLYKGLKDKEKSNA